MALRLGRECKAVGAWEYECRVLLPGGCTEKPVSGATREGFCCQVGLVCYRVRASGNPNPLFTFVCLCHSVLVRWAFQWHFQWHTPTKVGCWTGNTGEGGRGGRGGKGRGSLGTPGPGVGGERGGGPSRGLRGPSGSSHVTLFIFYIIYYCEWLPVLHPVLDLPATRWWYHQSRLLGESHEVPPNPLRRSPTTTLSRWNLGGYLEREG